MRSCCNLFSGSLFVAKSPRIYGKISISHKNCQEQDQLNDTSIGGFDAILDSYNDSSLDIDRPPKIDADNVDPSKLVDPTTPRAPGTEDNAKWLEEVWSTYIKPKYKLILQKWYKDTGGGARTLSNCVNYCQLRDGNYPWMVWVYYLDLKSDFF